MYDGSHPHPPDPGLTTRSLHSLTAPGLMLGPYSPSHNPMGLMPHTTHPFLPYAQWAPGTHSVLPGEPSLGGGEQGMVRSEGLGVGSECNER